MKPLHITTHIESETLHLPQLREWIGHDVEITVKPRGAASGPDDNQTSDRYPLRASILRDDDPLSPAVHHTDWHTNSDPRYPLRGTVLRYDDPFEPIDADWDAPR